MKRGGRSSLVLPGGWGGGGSCSLMMMVVLVVVAAVAASFSGDARKACAVVKEGVSVRTRACGYWARGKMWWG